MGAVTIGQGLSLVIALLQNAAQISELIRQAQAAGQTELDATAWAAIKGNDDSAMAQLAKDLGIDS